MSIKHRLKQFRQRIVILTIVVFGVMINLGLALRPYFSAWYDYFFSQSTNTPCNCSQLVTLPTHSLTLDALLALIGVFTLLLGLAVLRVVFTLIRTKRYEATLKSQIMRTTIIRGIAVHRVDRPEALAVCMGYMRPQIYISQTTEGLLQADEFLAVLKHELHHAKQYDPLQRLGMSLLAYLFPFVTKPFAGYQALQELAADEAVNDDQRLRQALVKLLQLAPSHLPATVVGFSATSARIDRLLGQRITVPTIWPIIVTALLFITVVLITYQDFSVQQQTTAFGQCVAAQPMCQQLLMSYVVP